jgi:hypothetical protein
VGALDVVQVLEEVHGKSVLSDLEEWAGHEKREAWSGEAWDAGVKGLRGGWMRGLC